MNTYKRHRLPPGAFSSLWREPQIDSSQKVFDAPWLHCGPCLIPPLATPVFVNNPIPNLARFRQLRIADTVHNIIRSLISHPHIRVQLVQVIQVLTRQLDLVGGCSK